MIRKLIDSAVYVYQWHCKTGIDTYSVTLDGISGRDCVLIGEGYETFRDYQPFLNVRLRRVGGMRFFRLGCLQLSWCITSKPLDAPREPRQSSYWKAYDRGFKAAQKRAAFYGVTIY